jgi:hypothetical protein
MPRLWRYVIRHDNGVAPNYDPPFTTVAICKPKIRVHAEVNDVVLAFASASLPPRDGAHWGRHDVVWAGVVGEKFSMGDYWNDPRFEGKKPAHTETPDNIYALEGLDYRQEPNRWHGIDAKPRDTGGKNVLVMQPAWRFLPGEREVPEFMALGGSILRMDLFARRGHRVNTISSDEKNTLLAWLVGRT